jgi:hypothetical protein
MKITLLFLFIFFSHFAKTQDITSGCWLPLKRLEQVEKIKNDPCDSASAYPFKKIKFFSSKEVSLFGFNAGDPDVRKIVPQKEKYSWKVRDTIFNTLYPELVFGSKVSLRIKNDTLYIDLTKNGVSFSQKFVRKYGAINLTDYGETEVGNILLKGKYSNSRDDTIQIADNGKMKGSDGWNYVFYRFKYYAPGSCRIPEPIARGIVELTDSKGVKEDYFIKKTAGGIDFYKILKIDYWWSQAKKDFAFSLFHVR